MRDGVGFQCGVQKLATVQLQRTVLGCGVNALHCTRKCGVNDLMWKARQSYRLHCPNCTSTLIHCTELWNVTDWVKIEWKLRKDGFCPVHCSAFHWNCVEFAAKDGTCFALHGHWVECCGWMGGALHFIALALHCIALQFIWLKLSGVLWARNEDGTGGTPAQYEHWCR